jgi:hypothetical protein
MISEANDAKQWTEKTMDGLIKSKLREFIE